ncbi:MAG: bifunctional 2-polyprenyl-6-hydroxyphenol methylase/3-demethylubiquinol 3-O-methyltransferase UbiG [Acetobacteraceae bacterium]|nr:bifunctional 2-polyprenyl-6-hydroxyphenol methylase/3-demethylubiquinol 3-O-methyltransferase UbiG [Acetobacteraceae bacterium]
MGAGNSMLGGFGRDAAGSVAAAEIRRFDALASEWWNPDGPMRPLHRMNPARIAWIADRIRARFPAGGVRLLDVGCGAGLASEALARRGFDVLGLDAADRAIAVARAHAAGQNLPLAYRTGAPEDLLARGVEPFAVVTALEVIEHVADPPGFVRTLAALVQPGGLLFVSTLNRTARSFLTAKIGAEYLLRLLPVGTHDWRQFVPPATLQAWLGEAGCRVVDIAGLLPDPLRGGWRTGRDLSVNYIAEAERG